MNPGEIRSNTSNDISARETFERLKAACTTEPYIPYEKRIETLKKIEQILTENDEAICDAVNTDFGNRSRHETKVLEIAACLMGIRYTLKRLKKWMKPKKRHAAFVFWGMKNQVIPQAKGVAGIVTPWNYPLFLALSPMTSAIAAGNRVMLKQAANSQTLCRLLEQLFSNEISRDIITILPGVRAKEFSSLPYDHLIFTGSPNMGRAVMNSASEHLTPVTLELGGKSPVIVLDDYDIRTAAKRIIFTKLMNAGQTCVAPDYLFIPENRQEAFIDACREAAARQYPDLETPDYTSIIDNRAYRRLMATLEDASDKGAEVISLLPGKQADDTLRKISPAILKNVTSDNCK